MAYFLQSKQQLVIVAGVALLSLVGCGEGGNMFFSKGEEKADQLDDGNRIAPRADHDVEAPDIFQVVDRGLWDGRPSLGGTWVAHSDVTDPDRVIVRNLANDSFVMAALFRREYEMSGPPIQVSSDAAASLGMLAGQPAELSIVAVRRENADNRALLDELNTPSEAPSESD